MQKRGRRDEKAEGSRCSVAVGGQQPEGRKDDKQVVRKGMGRNEDRSYRHAEERWAPKPKRKSQHGEDRGRSGDAVPAHHQARIGTSQVYASGTIEQEVWIVPEDARAR